MPAVKAAIALFEQASMQTREKQPRNLFIVTSVAGNYPAGFICPPGRCSPAKEVI
jgi:uncharacterized membrane protein